MDEDVDAQGVMDICILTEPRRVKHYIEYYEIGVPRGRGCPICAMGEHTQVIETCQR